MRITAGKVHIVILGRPAPQGSKTPTRSGMREANKRTKPWRETIRSVCLQFLPEGWTPLDEPIRVELWCYFTPPKTAKLGDFPMTMYTNDLDKLARAIGDGITAGGIIKDDARIVEWHLYKRYTWDDNERAEVAVSVLPPQRP